MRTQARLGAGDMWRQHTLGGHLGMVKEAVGGARLVPAPTGRGNTHCRFLPQLLQQPPRTTIEALVTQANAVQLRGQGAHAVTPSMARKSARSG